MALWGGSGIMPDTDKNEYHQSLIKFTNVCKAFIMGEDGYHYYEQQFYDYVVPKK